MVDKRKREDLSDSDSDEITPGKQILPVANLPLDFDQEPKDGMQYLFLVRRDARRLPHVTRVYNPYEVPETKVALAPSPLSTSNVLPCKEWRVAFQTHFSNLRKNLTQSTIRIDRNQSGSERRAIPEKKDRDAWWKFLTGYPESVWSPRKQSAPKKIGKTCYTHAPADLAGAVHSGDATSPDGALVAYLDEIPRNASRQPKSLDIIKNGGSTDPASLAIDLSSPSEVGDGHMKQFSPPEITPSHLQEIDHRTSIHLLMYFTHWINVHLQNPDDPLTIISTIHGQWIFALLAKVEDHLSANDMNLLRNLARACVGLIQRCNTTHVRNSTTLEETSTPTLMENTTGISDVSCWMIFTAIAGYWGQRDLWADAETALSSDRACVAA